MPTKNQDEQPDEAQAEQRASRGPKLAARYRVIGSGLTGANGRAYYRDAVVTVEELGGETRVRALLGRVRVPIEAVEE